jgi:alkylation response protein AidB-like acyl-CoA dehydrogenase
MAIHVTNAAMQLLGGNGYSRDHPLERMLRDARMFTFGGGSSEIQRIGIASHILGRSLPQHRDL